MPTAEFFSQFGLIAFRNFLERDFCDALCGEMQTASKSTGFYRDMLTGEDVIDVSVKKRSEVEQISSENKKTIIEKLREVMPGVKDHFGHDITKIELPKFCLYEANDFYGIHVDAGAHENIPDEAKRRKVSVIIFLNDESREPEEGKYCGGNLTFYGLNQNEAFAKFGMPLVGEQGMLITFPPTLPHEVTPVTSGERFTIATWFI